MLVECKELLEMVVAIKHCMMFQQIHADWAVQEVLDKYEFSSVQLLAKATQEKAEELLKRFPPV